mmetsp:Transcript_62852/g.183797  ORF Transcript_62852/g.183797 Transcript_62852/m.183797 type:complete len:144 (+) Transcript_62852:696-1127(+)
MPSQLTAASISPCPYLCFTAPKRVTAWYKIIMARRLLVISCMEAFAVVIHLVAGDVVWTPGTIQVDNVAADPKRRRRGTGDGEWQQLLQAEEFDVSPGGECENRLHIRIVDTFVNLVTLGVTVTGLVRTCKGERGLVRVAAGL